MTCVRLYYILHLSITPGLNNWEYAEYVHTRGGFGFLGSELPSSFNCSSTMMRAYGCVAGEVVQFYHSIVRD